MNSGEKWLCVGVFFSLRRKVLGASTVFWWILLLSLPFCCIPAVFLSSLATQQCFPQILHKLRDLAQKSEIFHIFGNFRIVDRKEGVTPFHTPSRFLLHQYRKRQYGRDVVQNKGVTLISRLFLPLWSLFESLVLMSVDLYTLLAAIALLSNT